MPKREKIPRGIWRSPEQRGRETDWTGPGLSVGEERIARDREQRKQIENSRGRDIFAIVKRIKDLRSQI